MLLSLPLALLALDPACLDGPAVEAALAAEHAPLEGRRVHLEEAEGGVRVSLKEATGETLVQRVVPAEGSCQAFCAASAVLVAAWLTELDRAHLPSPPSPPWHWEVGAAARALAGPPGPTWGALAEVGWGTQGRNWTTRAELGVEGPRDEALAPGRVRWQRFTAALGGTYRFSLGKAFVAGRAEAVGALLSLRGLGYTSDSMALGGDVGACVGVRAGWPLGAFTPWVDLSATGWWIPARLHVVGVADGAVLPHFDAALSLGVSWARL